MNQRALHYYEFGRFRLNATERVLQRGSDLVPLTPKVFDTLLVLVENNGHVVEKTELMQQLWPDSFVEESSLTQNISLLRRALSELGDDSTYIETIPKRGYRFVADVHERNEMSNGNVGNAFTAPANASTAEPYPVEQTSTHPSQSHKRTNSYLTAFSGCLLLGVVITFAYWYRHKNASESFAPKSVAVLPFNTIGGNSENDQLGLGMADALIIKLSHLDQLTVLPTSSVFRYVTRDRDAVSIGRDLGVEAVLDGTVQRDGDWVRVTAQLIRLRDGKTVWSGKFDERYSSIFSLQDSISDQLSISLRPQVTPNDPKLKVGHSTENTEAYQAYLTGLYFWNRRTKENLPKAIEHLERAVTLDPNFAHARAILADCYYLTGQEEYGNATSEEAVERASVAVTKALELDDTLSEAHTVKAGIKLSERQFDEAAREFQRAIELNPNYATAHVRYAYCLFFQLNLEDALYHMRRAQQLDPTSAITNGALAGMLFDAHDFDASIEYSKRSLELEPRSFAARVNLGEAYAQKRMFTEAQAAFDVVRDSNPGFVYWEKANAYALEGKRDDAVRSMAEAQKYESGMMRIHFNYAQVYAAMGEKDKAFAELNSMSSARFMMAALKFDPIFDPIRNDPRFAEVVKRRGIN